MFTRSQLKHQQGEYPVGNPFGGPAFGKREDFIFGGDDPPPPPDYTPVAAASAEAAKISAELGREQLAETRRQYDINRAVSDKVVNAQLGLMDQTKRQGDDYYEYMRANQRPVESELNRLSMQDVSGRDAAERAAILGQQQAMYGEGDADRRDIMENYAAMYGEGDSDRAAIMDRYNQLGAQNSVERGLITGGDTGVYNARRGDIEDSVGRAVADARMGQAQSNNQAIRQGMRYGWSPAKIAAAVAAQSGTAASQVAGAANTTRTAGIDRARGQMAQSYDMRNANDMNYIQGLGANAAMRWANRQNIIQGLGANAAMRSANRQGMIQGMTNNRGMRIQDDATGWARKMDVAGLYRNLPGASQGAYGLSINSGNAAVANTMAPGNALVGGMAQGADMTMRGQGQKLQGLSTVAGLQSNNYNSALQNDSSGMGSVLGMAKMGMDIAGAAKGLGWITSDRRLKENIKLVGKDERTGLNLYEFSYIGDGKRLRGVMADEVEAAYPDAVVYDDLGFASVNYGALGLEMVEV